MKVTTMAPGLIQLINEVVKAVTRTTVKEGISRIKDAIEENKTPQPAPSKPTPPKPPVRIEQQPGPIMRPKPKESTQPTQEQILAFAKRDPDLQSLVSRYSNTINKSYSQPLNSMYNPQGQKFLRELNSLVKTKFKA